MGIRLPICHRRRLRRRCHVFLDRPHPEQNGELPAGSDGFDNGGAAKKLERS
ncbi:AAEL010156-PA [Aedes aegypti]|uniref:AAEL010156-PA n=1 Tax=Aedes aegypti TaxID=7159 RepID=Q16TR1_AEDAE|nr:AAEL010156-PA [Aedes aegypti]